MSDRPAPTTQTTPTGPPPSGPPAPPVIPPAQSRTPKPPKAPKAPKAPKQPAGAPVPADGDTAVRPGLAERIQAKLSSGKTDDGAAPVEKPVRKPKSRGPRRARLRLTRIDPWSVMKTAFLLSIAFGIVTVVAVAMIWEVIGAAGVWTSINDTVKEVINEPGTADFDIQDYVGTDRVLGFTMLVAAVDVVLITAIATLAAFLYNMSAALLGGIEVTLAEDN